jgi:hypothetical protein
VGLRIRTPSRLRARIQSFQAFAAPFAGDRDPSDPPAPLDLVVLLSPSADDDRAISIAEINFFNSLRLNSIASSRLPAQDRTSLMAFLFLIKGLQPIGQKNLRPQARARRSILLCLVHLFDLRSLCHGSSSPLAGLALDDAQSHGPKAARRLAFKQHCRGCVTRLLVGQL